MNLGIFSEIASTLKRNKLRTFLTGFSISWGIFMLIVLLSAGNGLQNGVTANFDGENQNVITVRSGFTMKEYKGYPKWREIIFDQRDVDFFAHSFSEVDQIVPSYSNWGTTVVYGKKELNVRMTAVYPQYTNFEKVELLSGRFINRTDVEELRKTMVIAEKDAALLFMGEEPIGKEVTIGDVVFKIVGTYKSQGQWRNSIYLPFSTVMQLYNPSQELTEIKLSVHGLNEKEQIENFENEVRAKLSRRHEFDPDDWNAVRVWSNMSQYLETQSIFNGINIFVWLIGIGTLIAGIVGVSNIMLITVRERTKEFGVRKAIGAKPASILKLVVLEALTITTIFGYIGMFCGIALMEGVNKLLVMNEVGSMDNGMTVFKDPSVDMGIVMAATVVLIVAGIFAGYVPAKRAVKIKPIEALRYE